MKKRFSFIGFIIGVVFLISLVGWVRYKIWRLEHPTTATWVFFISSVK